MSSKRSEWSKYLDTCVLTFNTTWFDQIYALLPHVGMPCHSTNRCRNGKCIRQGKVWEVKWSSWSWLCSCWELTVKGLGKCQKKHRQGPGETRRVYTIILYDRKYVKSRPLKLVSLFSKRTSPEWEQKVVRFYLGECMNSSMTRVYIYDESYWGKFEGVTGNTNMQESPVC